ncbi:MAG: hypothetical protein ACTTKI_03280 [Tannerella sp.]|uniref:hypothetical protein n=1 Tax=Tannerella sp. TaxID=2382127 RepID=UPI003FA20B74
MKSIFFYILSEMGDSLVLRGGVGQGRGCPEERFPPLKMPDAEGRCGRESILLHADHPA